MEAKKTKKESDAGVSPCITFLFINRKYQEPPYCLIIAVWVIFLPAPRVKAHFINAFFSSPA